MARLALTLVLMAAPALATPPKAVPQNPSPTVQVAAAPAVPMTPSVKNGVELWRAGDYAGAVAMWQPYANGGDADAMFNIGQAYKLGRAVPKDAVGARDWYRKAALKGHLPAQANLGILLFQAGEKAEAVRWLKAAADKNEMRAQYVLGVANWNGDGVPRSMTLAYGYLARASAQGLPEATTALNNLTNAISPVERANGWAVATSLAAGNGVPKMFVPSASQALASTDTYDRNQVIKPAPRPIVVGSPPAMNAVPAPKSAAEVVNVPSVMAPAAMPVAKPATVTVPPAPVAVAGSSVPRAAPVIPLVVVAAAAPPRPAPMVSTPLHSDAVPAAVLRPQAPAVASVAMPASMPATPAPKPPEVAMASPQPIAKTQPVAKPAPKPIDVAEAKPVPKAAPKPTEWRIQLGAFSKMAQAEAAWSEVKMKQKQLVGTQKPIYEADGSVNKLQMGPYTTKLAARDACAKIAFTGRACFVTEG